MPLKFSASPSNQRYKMSKLSVVERERKRSGIRTKYLGRREVLRELLKAPAPLAEKEKIFQSLYKLPRNSSIVRKRNRCFVTGRGRGTYRLFGISRMIIRELAAKGELPGVTQSSW